MSGRPIRFLVGVAGGWTLLRVAMLWGDEVAPLAIVVPSPASANSIALRFPMRDPPAPAARIVRKLVRQGAVFRPPKPLRTAGSVAFPASPPPAVVALPPARPFIDALDVEPQRGAVAPPLLVAAKRARWAASSWLLLRGAGDLGAAPGSQLGGGQAGVRIDRAIGGGFALTGRLTTPLGGRGREAALGLAGSPPGIPLRVVAEQRIAVDGGRGGPSLFAAGGVSELPLAAGLRAEGYAQGGVIARAGGELFVDGATRVFRPVGELGGVKLDLGIGAWGARQRGAGRLDIGPSVALRLPIGGEGARLQLDWRQRIAGEARPGSGPALTLSADF